MAEWSKAPVLKTGEVHASVGSNPTPSATTLATTVVAGTTRFFRSDPRRPKENLPEGGPSGRFLIEEARRAAACRPARWFGYRRKNNLFVAEKSFAWIR